VNQINQQKALMINNIPVLGILLFIALFLFASTLYPGGSQDNLHSIGFDWLNNYWCNLMNEKGMNGELNPARPYSILAVIILCFSLMVFFIQFAKIYSQSQFFKRIIKFGGIFSMLFASLIFTSYHDSMTIISSFFGLFVVFGIIQEIYKSSLTNYKTSGIICLLLLGVNNYIYYSHQFIEWLPIIQKVTLLIILLWIIGLNYEVKKKIKMESDFLKIQ